MIKIYLYIREMLVLQRLHFMKDLNRKKIKLAHLFFLLPLMVFSQQYFRFDEGATYTIKRSNGKYQEVSMESVFYNSNDSLIKAKITKNANADPIISVVDLRTNTLHYFENKPTKNEPEKYNFVYKSSRKFERYNPDREKRNITHTLTFLAKNETTSQYEIKIYKDRKKKKELICELTIETEPAEKNYFKIFSQTGLGKFPELENRIFDSEIAVKKAQIYFSITNIGPYEYDLQFIGKTSLSFYLPETLKYE